MVQMSKSLNIPVVLLLSVWLAGQVNAFCTSTLGAHQFHKMRTSNTARRHVVTSESLFDFASLNPLIQSTSLLENIDLEGAGLLIALSVALFASTARPPARLVSSATLDAIVQGSFLERAGNLKCVYKASRDGWSAIDFHESVDGRGSGVVVARSLSGRVFGGYNPVGWRSTDDYYTSTAAFLWCLRGQKVVKLPILTGGNAAVFDYATGGPCFSSDLQIGAPQAAVMGGFAGPDMEDMSINAGNLRQGKSSVGITYNWDDSWPARGSFRLQELEVYCND